MFIFFLFSFLFSFLCFYVHSVFLYSIGLESWGGLHVIVWTLLLLVHQNWNAYYLRQKSDLIYSIFLNNTHFNRLGFDCVSVYGTLGNEAYCRLSYFSHPLVVSLTWHLKFEINMFTILANSFVEIQWYALSFLVFEKSAADSSVL